VAAVLICSADLAAVTANQKKRAKTSASAPQTSRTRKKAVTRQSWRASQSQPTPERYKQFQEALIAKGYLHGEATGVWDQASMDAMRRFQKDQNLEPTGKPDQSLTIIALGLGPKYAESPSVPSR